MTILPENPPPVRRELNVPPRLALVAAVVVVIAAVGGYFVLKGGGSSASATPADAAAPAATTAAAPGTTGPRPKTSAHRLIAIAERSLKHINWGHSTIQITASNGNTETQDIRGGPHVQRETETFDGHVAQVILIGKVAYILSDELFLEQLRKFPAAEAQLGQGQWVKLVPGDRPYRSVGQDIGTGSKQGIPIHKPLSVVGTLVRDGVPTVEIQGVTGKGAHQRHVTVYLDTTRRHVPVEYDEVGVVKGVTVTVQATFSDFGKKVRIAAPRGAISYQSLVAESGT